MVWRTAFPFDKPIIFSILRLSWVCVVQFVVIGILIPNSVSEKSSINNDNSNTKHYLDENSVVLITGAAGFLGSELAIALHRTYNVKKLICVDSMDHGFGLANSSLKSENTVDGDDAKKSEMQQKQLEMTLFEFKRQRMFRVLQAAGATAHFYRVDFRPSIPEYFDGTEVPVLHHIFTKDHPEITHVVHFADHYHRTGSGDSNDILKQPVVPRVKGGEKAGMIEALLEQIRYQLMTTGSAPHFVYASSGEVYDIYATDVPNHPNPPSFREHLPITTPSSIAGTTKLLDEIIAQTYSNIVGQNFYIKSIGLRFFNIYGPWGLPGSPLYELAEAAVLANADSKSLSNIGASNSLTKSVVSQDLLDHIKDYCFIDDAIDAVMAAMQFTPPDTNPAMVFNVGSGQGTTLRSIAKIINEIRAKLTPENEDYALRQPPTTSIASLDRSKALLGYEPRVSLKEGLEKTLAWHYDRAYPYGTGAVTNESDGQNKNHIANLGMVACPSPYDTDCLKGTAVFPCASDCAHPQQCLSTLYDDVLELTRTVTSECTTVMYTVSLDPTIQDIPSVHVRVSSQSMAFVEDGGGYCNIAFVPDKSPLYSNAAKESHHTDFSFGQSSDISIVKFGFWTLIPVAVTEFVQPHRSFIRNKTTTLFSLANNRDILELIPKLSPELFFGSKVQHAIYCDTNVIFDSIPRLLREANMQPEQKNESKNKKHWKGATVMLIGKKQSSSGPQISHRSRPLFTATTDKPSPQLIQQETAYRTIQMALIDDMVGADGGLTKLVDSSFIVHNNVHRRIVSSSNKQKIYDYSDIRFFRCDMLGEVIQWNVPTDNSAIEFIMSLHDMWSRTLVESSGLTPWWIGSDVITIPADTYNGDSSLSDELEILFGDVAKQRKQLDNEHRRLQEVLITNSKTKRRRLEEFEEKTSKKQVTYGGDSMADDDEAPVNDNGNESDEADVDGEHNGFGVVQEAFQAVLSGVGMGTANTKQQYDHMKENERKVVERYEQPGSEERSEKDSDTEIDDFVVNDDDENAGSSAGDDDAASVAGGYIKDVHHRHHHDIHRTENVGNDQSSGIGADPSSYDIWMGVISSPGMKGRYFSRIVSMEAVGAYQIDRYYDTSRTTSANEL